MKEKKQVKFIDLFAGIGGIRIGFKSALEGLGYEGECVFTSEIKLHAIKAYKSNFPSSTINGDITKINEDKIPDFDFLLAGFPCQPFSFAGSRKGFADTRGTLFFDIERILKKKQPEGFLLENVEGLITHDKEKKTDSIGRTLSTILNKLEDLGYYVTWELIDASLHGVPQRRKRIYIVGTKKQHVSLANIPTSKRVLSDILDKNIDKD